MSETKRVKLTISYDGTRFHGFQFQNNAVTVQGEFESSLAKLFGKEIKITGCSRTDAGVHAERFVLHADIPSFFPTNKIHLALNTFLPDDISVLSGEDTDEAFHARYSCVEKTYRYVILNRTVRDPFYVTKAWHFPYVLNVDDMNKAAEDIIGEQDFSSFMAQGSPVSSTIRNVKSCYVERNGDLVCLYITANGFLYNMVRIVTGTLAAAGTGKLTESVKEIISSHDRTRAGITAPPQGLYLYEVKY